MTLTDEELAQYQRLSDDYVPEAEGPLVSQRQPSQQITNEYAQASAVYVHKTTALAQKFSHYRTVRGDGNCGWRALAFGYFEALLRATDNSWAWAQITRLTTLSYLLDSVGYNRDMYEDFMAETMRLHDHIVRTTPNRDDGAALLTSFNDPNVCNGIIMHFRLITGAWMKSNPDNYVPYTEGVSIDRYCATHIEPYAVEIENIGLQAYFDAILKPAGIALQVLYLDQSPGEQVTELNWPAGITHGTSAFGDVPTIRLLYRPGHYDVIYKPEDLPINLAAAVEDPRIWLMSHPRFLPSRNLCYAPQQGLDLNNFHLPGFTSAGICTMPFTTDPCPAPAACAPPSLSLSSPMSESYSISHSATPHDAIPANSPPFLQELSSEGRFRPSWYQLQMQQKPAAIQTEPCQTEAMKQAGESSAHFRNKKFQPQMWDPEAEYSGSRKSSSASSPDKRRTP